MYQCASWKKQRASYYLFFFPHKQVLEKLTLLTQYKVSTPLSLQENWRKIFPKKSSKLWHERVHWQPSICPPHRSHLISSLSHLYPSTLTHLWWQSSAYPWFNTITCRKPRTSWSTWVCLLAQNSSNLKEHRLQLGFFFHEKQCDFILHASKLFQITKVTTKFSPCINSYSAS